MYHPIDQHEVWWTKKSRYACPTAPIRDGDDRAIVLQSRMKLFWRQWEVRGGWFGRACRSQKNLGCFFTIHLVTIRQNMAIWNCCSRARGASWSQYGVTMSRLVPERNWLFSNQNRVRAPVTRVGQVDILYDMIFTDSVLSTQAPAWKLETWSLKLCGCGAT
jgi:hypothetical protein